MSAVPAIARAEDNIENISSWSAKMEGNASPIQPLGKEVKKDTLKLQNHASKEKIATKQEAGDVVTNGPNHVLRPAKIENLENSARNPSLGKSTFIIKAKPNAQTMIGAYGDGFPQNDKVVSVTDQKCAPPANHQNDSNANCEAKLQKTSPPEETSRIPRNKTSAQSYAKVAQNTSANLKTSDANLEKTLKSKKGDANRLKTSPPRHDSVPVMNGGLEDATSPVPAANQSKSLVNKETSGKTLDEIVGPVSKFVDESAKPSNDRSIVESDTQILVNPERDVEENEPAHCSAQLNSDADASQGSKLNSGPLRREAEKPPRMQKQRSQDRLPLKQQKQSFEMEPRKETLSRDSSFECVDSTGVDVHEFLVHKLQNSPRDRPVLLKMEQDIIDFIDNKIIDFMKFPPMTSYLRMLVHRVATYFGMDHNVDETGKSVIINKTSSTRLPELRFADLFDPDLPDEQSGRKGDDMRKRSILKRTNQSRSFDRDDMKGSGSWKHGQRSIEERMEVYEKTRARLFKNFEGNVNSQPVYERNGISPMASARMALWSDRPWNSTEMDGMRMQGPPPLTTRASSYSSILPRHNNVTSGKTGPPGSLSPANAGMQNFTPGRQPPHNMGPRPPTPRRRNGVGENNKGTYYYMQHQNQGMPYLSQDGYQLLYQGPTAGDGGVGPVPYARYYQMPPQPPPSHSGMAAAYPQGHNPYEESLQKGQNSNSSEYTMMPPPMSAYSHDMSSTTTVYSSIQGQPSLSYAYQPTAVYRPTFDPPPMGSNPPTQSGMQGVAPQGKQTPVMQGGQNFVPQGAIPGTQAYPTCVLAQPTGPLQAGDRGPQHPSGAATPRTVMGQPIPAMHQVPPIYPQQGIVLPSCASTNKIPARNDALSLGGQNDPAKSSGQTQDAKKTPEDELDEKMQAIVLKNMQQQQQQQGQMPHAAAQETVTNQTQIAKPVPAVATHQFTNANGAPQAQPMQVYLMPNASPTGGASYRTYSQFVTQPQTPHVMGPGMHFVYLSPHVGGVDASGAVAMNPHMSVYQMPAAVPQGVESSPAYVSNANNSNNVAGNEETEEVPAGRAALESKPEGGAAADVRTAGAQNGVVFADGKVETDAVQNVVAGHLSSGPEGKNIEAAPECDNMQETTPRAQSSTVASNEQVGQNHATTQSTTAAESNHGSTSNAPPSGNKTGQAYHVHNHPVMQHPPPAQMLLSNVPPPYTATGPVSYPPGVVPQYHVYPGGVSPAPPYIYLPTAAAINQKQPEARKLYPAKGAHTPGLIAVQIPNQIQYVPAASLHTHNQVYYPPHNYIATEYTNQVQVSAQAPVHQSSKQKASPHPNDNDAALQDTDAVAVENATPQEANAEITEQGQLAENVDASKPEETTPETAEATAVAKM